MSALWAPLPDEDGPVSKRTLNPGKTSKRSAGADERPRLRSVPAPERLARFPFVLVLVGLFALGMGGLLMLNTTLQDQAFTARALTREATELSYTEAALQTQINELSAPQELARRASALGMRANPQPGFVVLPAGKVVGDPKPVSGNEVPQLVIKTPAQIKAERARAEAKRLAEAKAAAEAKRQAEARAAAEAKAKADAAASARAAAEAKAKADAEAKKKADKEAKKKARDGGDI